MKLRAGIVANSMMEAGRSAIAAGVAEFEVALVAAEAGTRKASELIRFFYPNSKISPNTHFLQIMSSGKDIMKTHHRATNRKMQNGDPVFLCFCGMTNFLRFKLGFDRTFWIGEVREKEQEVAYNIALKSQQAALNLLGPGVEAESVHAAYAEVIRDAGYEFPFRCDRATGFSFLENPQLVVGDRTIIKPGMIIAIDGSVTSKNFRAQVGDSVLVNETGWEFYNASQKNF